MAQTHVEGDDEFEIKKTRVWENNLEPCAAIAGSLLAITTLTWIGIQAGVVEMKLNPEKLSALIMPTIAGIVLIVAFFLLFLSNAVTYKPQMIRRKKGKADKPDTEDEVARDTPTVKPTSE